MNVSRGSEWPDSFIIKKTVTLSLSKVFIYVGKQELKFSLVEITIERDLLQRIGNLMKRCYKEGLQEYNSQNKYHWRKVDATGIERKRTSNPVQ